MANTKPTRPEKRTTRSDRNGAVLVRRVIEDLGKAARLLQVARDAFGNGEMESPDLAGIKELMDAVKPLITTPTSDLFELNGSDRFHGPTQDILARLYDTLDVLFLVEFAISSRKQPSGQGITCCPISGGLSVLADRLIQATLDLEALIGTARSIRKAA